MRFVLRDGALVPKHLASRSLSKRSDTVRAPYIRSDGMDPIQSQADGRTYDSRSAYYRSVREAGCEIVGDDRDGYGPPPSTEPEGVAESISEAIEQLGGM